jgi:hypothetical protein
MFLCVREPAVRPLTPAERNAMANTTSHPVMTRWLEEVWRVFLLSRNGSRFLGLARCWAARKYARREPPPFRMIGGRGYCKAVPQQLLIVLSSRWGGSRMKAFLVAMMLSSSAFAQGGPISEPRCLPIGRTSKGDLVYSMDCRSIPGLSVGTSGYNPPLKVTTIPIRPEPPEDNKKENSRPGQ